MKQGLNTRKIEFNMKNVKKVMIVLMITLEKRKEELMREYSGKGTSSLLIKRSVGSGDKIQLKELYNYILCFQEQYYEKKNCRISVYKTKEDDFE